MAKRGIKGYRRTDDEGLTDLGALIKRLRLISDEAPNGCWIIRNLPNLAGQYSFGWRWKSDTFGPHLRRALESSTGKKFPPRTMGVRKCYDSRCINPQHVKFMSLSQAMSLLRQRMELKKEERERERQAREAQAQEEKVGNARCD